MIKASVLLLCSTAVFAQDQMPRSTTRSRVDVGTNVQQAVVDFYDSMSDYFRQSPRAVEALAQKGIPDGEIPAVLMIARRSSASPNQVVDARKSGQSFQQIAKANNVKLEGEGDFVSQANVTFLAEYHGRPAEEIRAYRSKGASFIEINQQYRRVGMKPRTEKPAAEKPKGTR